MSGSIELNMCANGCINPGIAEESCPICGDDIIASWVIPVPDDFKGTGFEYASQHPGVIASRSQCFKDNENARKFQIERVKKTIGAKIEQLQQALDKAADDYDAMVEYLEKL